MRGLDLARTMFGFSMLNKYLAVFILILAYFRFNHAQDPKGRVYLYNVEYDNYEIKGKNGWLAKLTLKLPKMKKVEFANSVDHYEAAYSALDKKE